MKQYVLAISGVKNSGKTTLITKLLPELKKRGLQVAVIKHDGHDFEPDVPGTDSWKYAQAGADGTCVFSAGKYMVIKYAPAPSVEELIKTFPGAELILLEGFKYSKAAYIITDKHEQIAKKIMHDIDRGVTGLKARGMYTGSEKLVLYCVVSRREIVQVEEIVTEIDPDAFVIVSDVREVLGEGFQEYSEGI